MKFTDDEIALLVTILAIAVARFPQEPVSALRDKVRREMVRRCEVAAGINAMRRCATP